VAKSPALATEEVDGRQGELASADSPVYLDHNSTTPVAPEVFEAMRPWLTRAWGNPSSAHVYGRRAAEAVQRAREQVAGLIGADPEEIIFTSCGTESDNLAILGSAEARGRRGTLLSSSIEHPAVERAIEVLQERSPGWVCRRIPTDRDGRAVLEPEGLCGVDLATLILAHNETGAIQPVGKLVEALRTGSPGAIVHSDAAQAVGKMDVDVRDLGVDLLTLVGHKFGAPKGVAALYQRRGIELRSQLLGGGQEGGLRSGTEAVAQVVALGAASELARERMAQRVNKLERQRESLWARLAGGIEGLHRTISARVPSLANTLHVAVSGLDGREILARTPLLAASTGSACHAGSDEVPGVLGQMGLASELARGALRLSIGFETTDEELALAADALISSCRSFG
jgi:cysteine desulfurase